MVIVTKKVNKHIMSVLYSSSLLLIYPMSLSAEFFLTTSYSKSSQRGCSNEKKDKIRAFKINAKFEDIELTED